MKFVCGFTILLVATGPALADDGYSALGAGGIVFTKSPDIAMQREDLYISQTKIHVRFEFRNESTRDIDALVAFPLPDIDPDVFLSPSVQPVLVNDPRNFVGFTARVDGEPVALTVEQKAIYKDRDVSGLVRAAGLPLNLALTDKYAHGLDGEIPRVAQEMLERNGIVDHGIPLWTVRTRFFWKQHFPVGKTVFVEHSYAPVAGVSQYSDYEGAGAHGDDDEIKAFCIDDTAHKSLNDMQRKYGPEHSPIEVSIVDYILMTANTWKRPIGHFYMTLDKGKPSAVLSLCWPGALRKTGPTTFEFNANNFAPSRNIHMAIIQ